MYRQCEQKIDLFRFAALELRTKGGAYHPLPDPVPGSRVNAYHSMLGAIIAIMESTKRFCLLAMISSRA